MITDFFEDNVNDVLDGYNSTIFAYGQTGSGKTFTMFGPHWDDNYGYQNTMGALVPGLDASFKSKKSANGGEDFLADQR